MIAISDTPSAAANVAPTGRSATRRRSAGTRQTALNRSLFWCLILLVALLPLPLASARPIFWALAAVYVGGAALIYALWLARRSEDFRFTAAWGTVPAVGFAMFCLALVLQMLPIGSIVGGFSVVEASGVHLQSDRISITPGMTMLMLMRQVTYGLFAFLMVQVLVNATRRLLLLDAMLIVIVVYAAYGMISLHAGDTILGMSKWAYLGSATGTFVNRNAFATFLSMGATLAVVRFAGLLLQRNLQRDNHARGNAGLLIVFGLAFAFLGIVVLATGSRLGLVAGTVGSTLGFVLVLSKADRRLRAIVLAGGVLIPVGGALALFADNRLDRLFDVGNDGSIRLEFYAQILELIARRPLVGWGGGSFEQAFPLVHRAPVNVDFTWSFGHNTYLTLWTEMGLVAGSIPVLIIAGLFVLVARRFARGSTDTHMVVPRVASLAVTALVGTHALGDFSLEIPANTFLFLGVLAAGASTLARPHKAK